MTRKSTHADTFGGTAPAGPGAPVYTLETVTPADDPDDIIRLVFRPLQDGDYESVLALAETALAANRGYIRAYAAKAIALLALGRTAEAFVVAESAAALAPKDALTHSVLGMCYARVGKDAEARVFYEYSLMLAPRDQRMLYNYACYAAARGFEAECARLLAAAAEIEPDVMLGAAADLDFNRYRNRPWFTGIAERAARRRNARFATDI